MTTVDPTVVPAPLIHIRERAINRPKYRGKMHAWFFVLSTLASIALVVTAPTARAAFAGWAFGFGTTAMFGISALFHLTDFDDRQWVRFRRLDHVGIYLCIAGGYTPFGMIALDGWARPMLLIAGWGGAALGTALRFLPFNPPYGVMNALFITLGWASILTLPQMWDSVDHFWMVMLIVGGVLYTGGAFVVGLRRPDPWPDVFGYHEIWHACVAVAATIHFCVMAFGVLPIAG